MFSLYFIRRSLTWRKIEQNNLSTKILNPQSFQFLTRAKICRTNESQICVSLLSVFSNCTPNKYSKHRLSWTVTRCSGWDWVLSVAMLYLCEYGCALWDEQCPYWHSCSSCTCTSHRRSSPGSPAAHQTLPPLACWPPRTVAGGRSARFWERLKTKTHLLFCSMRLKLWQPCVWRCILTSLERLSRFLRSTHRARDHVYMMGLLCQVFLEFPYKIHGLRLNLLYFHLLRRPWNGSNETVGHLDLMIGGYL